MSLKTFFTFGDLMNRKGMSFVALAGLVAPSNGCFEFNPNVGYVEILGTHHGTPQDGKFPDFGAAAQPRVFKNDEGWKIKLSATYVTTTAIELESCTTEERAPVELNWGPLAENFIEKGDRANLGIGTDHQFKTDLYCTLRISFGPYDIEIDEDDEDPDHFHDTPEDDEILGNTIYVRGTAEKDGEKKDFDVISDTEFVAKLDISYLINGDPFEIKKDPNPRRLIVSKVYDKFFEGVDFDKRRSEYEDAIEKAVVRSLKDYSYVTLGQSADFPSSDIPSDKNGNDANGDNEDTN